MPIIVLFSLVMGYGRIDYKIFKEVKGVILW